MTTDWKQILRDRLQLYGHRNWLVIADSAYPAQSRQGVETIATNDEQASVIERTFAILRECKHIRPEIYTDEELRFVPEEDAPGVTFYRNQLARLLGGYKASPLPHDEIISKLDWVGEKFRVLVIKTTMRIPYTSVFVELQCGYWDTRAEDRLRAIMMSKDRSQHAWQHPQEDEF